MKIFKETLAVKDEQSLALYADAEILTVQVQKGVPRIWYTTNQVRGLKSVSIYTHGTGHEINPNAGRYIGTYQSHDGGLVFHVFEGK